MRKLITFLIAAVLLYSCSATWHLKRAIKKDPTIVHTEVDTIVKTISDSGVVDFHGDTLVENNFVFISVKHEGEKTKLYWFLKSIKIEFPAQINTISPPKSRQEIRQENKTIRTTVKAQVKESISNNSTKIKIAKEQNKKEVKISKNESKVQIKSNGRLQIFLIGLLVGLFLSVLPKLIKTFLK